MGAVGISSIESRKLWLASESRHVYIEELIIQQKHKRITIESIIGAVNLTLLPSMEEMYDA